MHFEKIIEITRIKQEIKEVEETYKDILPERIKGSTDALDFAQALIGDEDREVFLVMCLNIKNEITVVHRCHVGELGASIIHPREVFKTAIMNNAHSIIVAHNHPSGPRAWKISQYRNGLRDAARYSASNYSTT